MAQVSGFVKSFNAAAGYGFIKSEGVEGDVYFQRQWVLNMDVNNLQGQPVVYELHRAKDGKPQGKNVQAYGSEPAVVPQVPISVSPSSTFSGTVKSFNAAKGFGFITSPSLPTDVYFQKKDVPIQLHMAELTGMQVRFMTNQTPDGKLQARDLVLSIAGPTTSFALPTMPVAVPVPVQLPSPMFPPGRSFVVDSRTAGFPSDGSQHAGVVKSLKPDKGFGFIEAPGFSQDVYFKLEGAGHLAPGKQVYFQLSWTSDGKPQARNIVAALVTGEVAVGTIKKVLTGKGFGFLSVTGHEQDVYFPVSELPAELQGVEDIEGASISFVVRMTKDMKPQAQGLQLISMPHGVKRQAEFDGGLEQLAKRARIDPYGAMAKAPSQATVTLGQGEKYIGIVKAYNAGKGFGFITSASVAGDVYLNKASLPHIFQMAPLDNRQVSFELMLTPDGRPQARQVQVLA